ncbi:putative NACHT and WD domain protein [Seiridium cardinale]
MFRKISNLGKKPADEDRESRFLRSPPEPRSPAPSPPGISVSTASEHRGSIASSGQLSHVNSLANGDTEPGPVGLHVVYSPEKHRTADIVFVHGLGGTSRWTWSKNKDPGLFWPLTFLPLEPDLCLARILTFGYNANFRKSGSVGTSVLDFAKDLLFDLKYAKDEHTEDLNMGHVPLIFVVHSMGGLIVKEAYMQGQHDPKYETIIKSISAITFLATPHRGTNLAETLNKILQSTMVSNSKQYITELGKNSLTLQKLNEQFRHIAPRLDIVSFYENQATSIGLKGARVMVLEKDSSVLGYPGETSKALDADHHGVCKYDSPRDPNYITVRNVLKSLVSKIISAAESKQPAMSSRRQSIDLKAMLDIADLPDTDYVFFRDQWTQGTCDWILQETAFQDWAEDSGPTSRLLWLNGGPASGKSILSSFIINHLVERGSRCVYFFARFLDQKKRSCSLLLRSIAYQLARAVPGFSQKVMELVDEALDFASADPRTIWERIFKSILFTLEWRQPLYWVIDGLDEAEDPRSIIKLLTELPSSSCPIRILFVGRKTSELDAAFQKVASSLQPRSIATDGHVQDLDCYIRQELSMFGNDDFKESIVRRIIQGAQYNFLWVRLAVEKLNQCQRVADVELALQELPDGMEALYDRMAAKISQNPSPQDKALAVSILQCVACSARSLSIAELSQALNEDTEALLDFQRSVVDLCGGFVVVDNGQNVAMVHQTAREYLLGPGKKSLRINRNEAHRQMFLSCMRSLTAVGLRAKVNRNQLPEFVSYASIHWSSHLASAPAECEDTIDALRKFLMSNWVLTWIHILAAGENLRILVQASRNITKYCRRKQEFDATWNASDHLDHEVLTSWATDLMKVLGKFGMILRNNPEAIYKTIAPFCPLHSSIYQQFGKAESRTLNVTGLSSTNWDDSLARISLGSDAYALAIAAAGSRVIILSSKGTAYVYNSSTFEESSTSPVKHGERVYRMVLNGTSTLLATYGYRTTKVWDLATGKCKTSVPNPDSRPRPLAMLLTDNSSTLLVGSDDKRIRSLDLTQSAPAWQTVADLEEPEIEGHILNASSYMALNKDGTLAAVAYRGHPLSAWEVEGAFHIGHCWRQREELARGDVIDAVWHPHNPEVFGLYIEGTVFKWSPYEGQAEEIYTGAARITISGDGNLLATGDGHGVVKIYTTSDLGLLYQFASQDSVLGIAFSPDLRRFYDIRGYYANAWEPNALIKFAEEAGGAFATESESESLTQSSVTPVSYGLRVDSITVLAHSHQGRFYCSGTDKGTVSLHDVARGQRLTDLHTSKGLLSIEQLVWSKDGKSICFCDSSKKVYVMSILSQAGNVAPLTKRIAEIPLKNSTKGPILQMLFQQNSNHIFVATPTGVHVISVTDNSVHSKNVDASAFQWTEHPRDQNLIVGYGPRDIYVLDWNLEQTQLLKVLYTPEEYSESQRQMPLKQSAVDRVLITHDNKNVLVQMSTHGSGTKKSTFGYFQAASLSTLAPSIDSREDVAKSIRYTSLPEEVSHHISIPLAFLSQDRLVYLSKTFSICSWKVPASMTTNFRPAEPKSGSTTQTRPSTFRTHTTSSRSSPPGVNELFPLPGDWISKDSLAICSVWKKERSLLCPRNGEIAVVKSAAMV